MKTKKLMMVALVSSTLALSGCGAMSTAIKKRNLEVKTQMSETIWLEPASERTVFLQIKNTSDKDMSGLQGKIADAVKAKGYQVVTSPDTAYYWIQANVLKADKMDLRESQGWLNRGYEGAAVGAALGAGITGIIILPVPHSVWALLRSGGYGCRCDGGRCELYHDHGCADCRAY
ncbi:enterobacterial TraT complement resistance family protein [Escherichia coli P0304777.9]|nr:enterobacterial TraT complement resistance family protein [Escherichia coli P0304777.9]